ATFNKALALWRGRGPADIYLKSHGPAPPSPPPPTKTRAPPPTHWYGPRTPLARVAHETRRAFGHTALGLKARCHAAGAARGPGGGGGPVGRAEDPVRRRDGVPRAVRDGYAGAVLAVRWHDHPRHRRVLGGRVRRAAQPARHGAAEH